MSSGFGPSITLVANKLLQPTPLRGAAERRHSGGGDVAQFGGRDEGNLHDSRSTVHCCPRPAGHCRIDYWYDYRQLESDRRRPSRSRNS
jgi:hypothetical protein